MFIQSGDRTNPVNALQIVDACVAAMPSALGIMVNAGREYQMNVAYDRVVSVNAELRGNNAELLGVAHRLADENEQLKEKLASLRPLRVELAQARARMATLERQLNSRK